MNNFEKSRSIGLDTLERSGARIPAAFLRGNGVGQDWIETYDAHDNPTAASDSFFIVYGTEEEPFAGRLHNTLQKHGVRCWLDPRRSSDDNGLTGQVACRGFRAWDRVLLCATRATLSADWMDPLIESVKRREEALEQQVGRSVRVMWPLNLDGYLFSGSWKHAEATEVAGRVLADFTGWRRNILPRWQSRSLAGRSVRGSISVMLLPCCGAWMWSGCGLAR